MATTKSDVIAESLSLTIIVGRVTGIAYVMQAVDSALADIDDPAETLKPEIDDAREAMQRAAMSLVSLIEVAKARVSVMGDDVE